MKKLLSVLMVLLSLCTFVFASGSSESADDPMSGTITFAIWDNNLNAFIEENDMVGKFQEVYPNAEIEVEKIKDDTEYWNSMRIRTSGGQLPDVMFNKPFTLARFQNYLLDLSDTEAAANNILAEGYAVDGKILGIPMTAGYEYVFYWKDMFEEAGVEVPETWPEFVEACLTLQEYYGAQNPDFIALGIGLKDEWPDYPFMEFMPALINGEGDTWNVMAAQDAPFAEGTDIRTAYERIYELFTSGVLGKDPLGLGNDQITNLFAAKQVAIFPSGDWSLQNIINAGADISELGTFYLPVRMSGDESYKVIVQGDSLMGVTTHSDKPELAKAFVEWFYSDAWYPDYLAYVSSSSAMANFPKEKDPVLAESDQRDDIEIVTYGGAGDDFTAIQNAVSFDYKKLGAQMLTEGFDLEAVFDDLNTRWAAARSELGIE